MPINWEDVRYRGDADDVRELHETYRVEDYIVAYEENIKQQEIEVRNYLMRDGIQLTERISPRVHRLYREVCAALWLAVEAEIFFVPEQSVNAFAVLDLGSEERRSLIALTAGALERLEDGEIKSIIGHELGHFLFAHNRLNALLKPPSEVPGQSATVLPPFGESLFLRWRQKAEISVDRAGLHACGEFHSAGRALVKGMFGLSERNLNLDIDGLLSQIDELKGRRELVEEAFASHPILPIRLKALELYSRSAKAKRNGLPVKGKAISDEALEGQIADLLKLSARAPLNETSTLVMEAVALAGAKVLSADGDVSDEEVKILVGILHASFTDEPEKVICTDRAEIEKRLPGVLGKLRKKGSQYDKEFVLCRLADIAVADGALMDPENGVILEVAEKLGVPAKSAYGIMVGAAQEVGFRSDVKLNRMAAVLRRSLQVGYGAAKVAGRPGGIGSPPA